MLGKLKVRQPRELPLNVSSLMDILTILLLFLILSFGSQEQDIVAPNFPLPDSQSEVAIRLAVQVTVGPDTIMVEEKTVVTLGSNQQIRGRDLNGEQQIEPLLKELQRQRRRLNEGTKSAASAGEDQIVYLQAFKDARFDLLQRVLTTAAGAGFTKFRLAVHRRG